MDLVTLVIQRRGTSQDPSDLFDQKANWDHDTGRIIFNNIIMDSCLVDDKMQRKSMEKVLELFCDLEGWRTFLKFIYIFWESHKKIEFNHILTYLQGVSYWSMQSKFALRGRMIHNFIELWCLVASGVLEICVSSTSFEKTDIGWPQQPPTEKLLKFNVIFHDSTQKMFFFKT